MGNDFIHRFLKYFGSCLPGRKGKGTEDAVTDTTVVHPKSTAPVEGDDATKDVNKEPETVEKENIEAKPDTEEYSPPISDENDPETEDEVEEGKIPKGREPVSSSEEISKTEEGSPCDEDQESNEGNKVMKVADAQDEDYQWELSCCGVDFPLTK